MSASNEWWIFADPDSVPYVATSTMVDIASSAAPDPNMIRHWSGLWIIGDEWMPKDQWAIFSPPPPVRSVLGDGCDPYKFDFDGILWEARVAFSVPTTHASIPVTYSLYDDATFDLFPGVEHAGEWRGY